MIGNKLAIQVTKLKKIIGNNLLIKPEKKPAQTTTKSGIIVVEHKQKGSMFDIGHIVKVGEGNLDKNGNRVPLDFKEGDKVLFATMSATPISIDDENYKIVSLPNIFLVIEE